MSCQKTVLVVDDDRDIRESICDLLSEEGYVVVTAENGAQALDRLRASSDPCVILLDLMMPVMDGIDFRSHQRGDPALADIPVIVVSASGDGRTTAASLDAADFIAKPIRVQQLISAVHKIC
jgi:CheY-like chemotaxis protein